MTDIRIECSADACLSGLFRGRGGQQLRRSAAEFLHSYLMDSAITSAA